MNKKEQKAKRYAKKCYPNNEDMRFQCEYHFETGWDEALKSQWVSVEERMPEVLQDVLILIEYDGDIQIHRTKYFGKKEWNFGIAKIIAWMPVPPFDKILKKEKTGRKLKAKHTAPRNKQSPDDKQ